MIVKIHRGTHQIGGTITEIKTANARIIIDIGKELPRADKSESEHFDIDGVTCGAANCNAVFVTHYHGDHVGMFENVLPQVPIYMGATAKKILTVLHQTLKAFDKGGKPELVCDFKEYEAGKPLVIGDIKVTPYCIDHSAYDAYMLLIEAEGKRILHTGDFRMHGARGRKMPLVFEKFARNIDVLICEGTMLSRPSEKVLTEHELGKEAKRLLQDNKNVFVLLSSTNIDTIAEFYNAAIQTRKPFIVCDKLQADILDIVSKTAKTPFYDFTRQKVYLYGRQLHKFMNDCGFCFIGRANSKTMKAIEQFSNNLLVYSMWTGYLNKEHPAFDEYKSDWIDKAVELGGKRIDLHTSGHATAEEIKRVIDITTPKIIIPIHSEKPDVFHALSADANTVVLQDGQSFEV